MSRIPIFALLFVIAIHVLVLGIFFREHKASKIADDFVVASAIKGQPLYIVSLLKMPALDASGVKEFSLSNSNGSVSDRQAEAPLNQGVVQTLKPEAVSGGNDGERFYRFNDLQKPATPIEELVWPFASASLTNVQAQVEVYVDRLGEVQQVKILMINSNDFAAPLTAAIFATKFSPALRSGLAVNSIKVMEISITF